MPDFLKGEKQLWKRDHTKMFGTYLPIFPWKMPTNLLFEMEKMIKIGIF